jgi:energy-coupling factor transporter ATP-binding protein EcfA2
MPDYSVYQVFTPNTQAKVNFIDRDAINDQLVDALRTPGKQLIIYGESGSGKSTLLLNKLEQLYANHITTQCSAATTYESLLLDAFDQLNPYYMQGRSSQRSKAISPSVQASFVQISANISKNDQRQDARLLPPQLTAQRLAQFLGEQHLCWVIEDFHKMPPEQKELFAQSLKVFSDVSTSYPDVKTITIGATETARQVVEYDPEMINRVSELHVPLMTAAELHRIIESGQQLLNVNLSEVAEGIVNYSLGMPSICHQLALNTCLEKNIGATQRVTIAFSRRDLTPALKRYVRESSDTIKAKFAKALGRRVLGKYNNCLLILSALASGPVTGMTFGEVLARIHEGTRTYPRENLRRYLRELTKEDHGQLLRADVGGKWRFISAVYHTVAEAMLLQYHKSSADTQSSNTYVEEIVANAFVSTVYTDNTWIGQLALGVTTGVYFTQMKDYLSSYAISTQPYEDHYIGSTLAATSKPKKPELYEAPARRTRRD